MEPNTITTPARKITWLVWGGLLIIITGLLMVALMASIKFRTAVAKPLPIISQVADFTLTNQFGKQVTLGDLRGKIWVADIIFTRCAGPCPRMTQQMRNLQQVLPAGSSVQLITLTTDPLFDTPEVLLKYAQRFGANLNNWMFLTGAPSEISKLATESLKLSAMEIDVTQRKNPADLFIHSTYFVLVDKQGRLRAVYDTSNEAITDKELNRRIVGAIRQLEREK